MADEQIKIMYYAPLPAGRPHAAFRERWRQHGELARSLPLWRHIDRYEHHDVLVAGEHGLEVEHLQGLHGEAFGGVGAMWFRNQEAMTEAVADPDNDKMRADELATFGQQLGTALVAAREVVVLDDGPPAITVINQLHRAAGVSREEFSKSWRAMGDEVVAKPELARHLRRYVQDHALPGGDGWDGIVELGFDTPGDFFAFMAEPLTTEWLFPHESAFIDIPRGRPVITAPNALFVREAVG